MQKLELTLKKKEKRPKCDIEKSFFGKTEMGYLGLRLKRVSIKTVDGKMQAIKNMKPLNFQKTV